MEERAQGWDYLAYPNWDWEAQWVPWVGLGVGELGQVQRPGLPPQEAQQAQEAELLEIHLKLVVPAAL